LEKMKGVFINLWYKKGQNYLALPSRFKSPLSPL